MLRMFAGPVEVERRRVMIHVVPLGGGSIEDSREFLIAKHECDFHLAPFPSNQTCSPVI